MFLIYFLTFVFLCPILPLLGAESVKYEIIRSKTFPNLCKEIPSSLEKEVAALWSECKYGRATQAIATHFGINAALSESLLSVAKSAIECRMSPVHFVYRNAFDSNQLNASTYLWLILELDKEINTTKSEEHLDDLKHWAENEFMPLIS